LPGVFLLPVSGKSKLFLERKNRVTPKNCNGMKLKRENSAKTGNESFFPLTFARQHDKILTRLFVKDKIAENKDV